MLFPTAEKVRKAFDELSAGYDQIDKKLSDFEDQHRAFGATLDPNGAFGGDINEIRDLYWIARGGYSEVSVALSFGQLSPRQAAKRIGPAKHHLAQLETIIGQMDGGAAAGRAAFKERFGT